MRPKIASLTKEACLVVWLQQSRVATTRAKRNRMMNVWRVKWYYGTMNTVYNMHMFGSSVGLGHSWMSVLRQLVAAFNPINVAQQHDGRSKGYSTVYTGKLKCLSIIIWWFTDVSMRKSLPSASVRQVTDTIIIITLHFLYPGLVQHPCTDVDNLLELPGSNLAIGYWLVLLPWWCHHEFKGCESTVETSSCF